jgi:hypothetical protein
MSIAERIRWSPSHRGTPAPGAGGNEIRSIRFRRRCSLSRRGALYQFCRAAGPTPARCRLNGAGMGPSNRRGFVMLSSLSVVSAIAAYVDFARIGDERWIEVTSSSDKFVVAVCHGPGVFRHTKAQNGTPLVKGKSVTGFSNSEEAAVGLTQCRAVPGRRYVERERRRLFEGGEVAAAHRDRWEPHHRPEPCVVRTGRNGAAASVGIAAAHAHAGRTRDRTDTATDSLTKARSRAP